MDIRAEFWVSRAKIDLLNNLAQDLRQINYPHIRKAIPVVGRKPKLATHRPPYSKQNHISFRGKAIPLTITMTLYEFKLLDRDAQAEATWEQGVLLSFREQGNRRMVLYSLDDFYVEVVYHTTINEIILLRSFNTDTLLEPYLNQIDITNLFT